MVFILYDIVLLLTLLLQDMMVWARDPGYSVAEVAISRAFEGTLGGDEMNAGETHSSRHTRYPSQVFV